MILNIEISSCGQLLMNGLADITEIDEMGEIVKKLKQKNEELTGSDIYENALETLKSLKGVLSIHSITHDPYSQLDNREKEYFRLTFDIKTNDLQFSCNFYILSTLIKKERVLQQQ